ncbi:anion permease [Shigella flexneri]
METIGPTGGDGCHVSYPCADGMPPQAVASFAVFVAMIVGMILEPIPATAIDLCGYSALLAVITCSLMPKN